jgi:integrase
LWAGADQLGGVEAQYLRILLLTGKRKSALAAMKWDEIDQIWFWTPPSGRKNKRLHAVPLAGQCSVSAVAGWTCRRRYYAHRCCECPQRFLFAWVSAHCRKQTG